MSETQELTQELTEVEKCTILFNTFQAACTNPTGIMAKHQWVPLIRDAENGIMLRFRHSVPDGASTIILPTDPLLSFLSELSAQRVGVKQKFHTMEFEFVPYDPADPPVAAPVLRGGK